MVAPLFSANSLAIANPIPLVDPVTTPILSFSKEDDTGCLPPFVFDISLFILKQRAKAKYIIFVSFTIGSLLSSIIFHLEKIPQRKGFQVYSGLFVKI
jgi:hypothetical protein